MHRSYTRFTTTALTAVLTLGLWAGILYARSGGISGTCDQADGCACHGDLPNGGGNVTVTITGPTLVTIGTTNQYTITVSGGPADTTGGFNLCADGGTLVPGTGTKLSSGQLTHSNGDNRSWTFEWTAPASEGTVGFMAAALASNGSSTSGDSWNWYGGVQGANFDIGVTSTVEALPASWGRIKARYR